MKKVVTAVVVAGLMLSFTACKKKEEKPQLPPGHPSMEGGMPPAGMPEMPKVDRKVVVSKEVAAKWKGVKLVIEDKVAKSNKEYSVNVGGEIAVPNTAFKIKVLAFLPDFKMTDKEFMSASDKPNMPAARVAVMENGKEIWNNWLFALQPGIHPFQNDKIGMTLAGGVSK